MASPSSDHDGTAPSPERNPAPRRRLAGRRTLLAVRLLPGIIGVVAVVFIFFWIVRLPVIFSDALETNRRWREAVPPPTASALTGLDFTRLAEARLVAFDRETLMVRHASCDGLAHVDVRRMMDTSSIGTTQAGPAEDERTRRSLLSLLCGTSQGMAVRREIAAWNLSFDLLALRDNRAVNQTSPDAGPQRGAGRRAAVAPRKTPRLCNDGSPVLRHYVQPHCFPSTWDITYTPPQGERPEAAPGRPGAAPPPDGFGFLATLRLPYASDWWVSKPNEAAPGEMEGGLYRLASTIPTGAEPVAVQLVGELETITLRGAEPIPIDETLLAKGTPLRRGEHTITVLRHCEPEDRHTGGNDRCPRKPPRGEPYAYTIEIRRVEGRAGAGEIALELAAHPIKVKPPIGTSKNPRLSIGARERAFTLARTQHLRVACPKVPAPCAIAWRDPQEKPSEAPTANGPSAATCPPPRGSDHPPETPGGPGEKQPRPPTVYERTCKIPLADGGGIMTEQARAARRAAVVGLGPAADGTLASQVARRDPDAGAVRLTIDMDLQRRAQRALETSDACREALRCQGLECSRGAFVVVDAGDDDRAGEILAAAACPAPLDGLSRWNLAVLDHSRPGESPIAGIAWHVHDVSAMPGSTFKPFTALAAIETVLARPDPDLRRLLAGVPEAEARRVLGIEKAVFTGKNTCSLSVVGKKPLAGTRIDTFPVKALDETILLRCIRNEESEPDLSSAVLQPRATKCPGPADAKQIGVCEALIESSNLYFAALASRVDRAALDAQLLGAAIRPAEAARIEGLALSGVVDRLFAARRETRPDGRKPIERPYPLLSLPDLAVRRLDADVVGLSVERNKIDALGSLRLDLALNGIGQAVEATPVQMASAYASLATGKIVRPTFVPREGQRGTRGDPREGQPIIEVPRGKEGEFRLLYDSIVRGLNGVVRTGTVAKRVPNVRANRALLEASYMKTGTATIRDLDSRRGQRALYSAWVVGWIAPVPGAPRLSRRLAFACLITRTHGFGGPTCGPIVDAFLPGLAAEAVTGGTR